MLYLLVGPSGVGKSSIMAELRGRYGWKVVPTYTTRPARLTDLGRISVTAEEFARLSEEGRLFTTKTIFGHRYGEDRLFIDRAQSRNGEKWCLDIALTEQQKFALPFLRTAIVLPASQEQLCQQLNVAGRGDRIVSAVKELHACEDFVRTLLHNDTVRAFRNTPNEISHVVELMQAWAMD